MERQRVMCGCVAFCGSSNMVGKELEFDVNGGNASEDTDSHCG